MDVSFIMPFDNICLVPYSLDNLSEKNRLPPTLGKPNSRDPIQSTKLHDNLSVWGCNPVRSPPKSSSSRKGKSIIINYNLGFSKIGRLYPTFPKMDRSPRVFNWPKSPGSLGLINYPARHIYLSQSIARNLQLCFHFLDALLHLLHLDEHRLHQFLGLTIGVWHLVLIGQKLAFVLKIKKLISMLKRCSKSIQS